MGIILQQFIERVGREDFQAAATRAIYKAKNWDTESKRTNTDSEIVQKDYEIITDLGEFILESTLEHKEKVDIYFDLYRIYPSYSLMSLIHVHYWNELFETSKRTFWKHVIKIFESDQGYLKEPIIYSLWCDFFESPKTVHESWKALVHTKSSDDVLKIVLVNSGPVPFYLKKELYYRLIGSNFWHYYIFRSLLHSKFEVYGDLDEKEATKILKKLSIPKNTEHLDLLLKKLGIENTRSFFG